MSNAIDTKGTMSVANIVKAAIALVILWLVLVLPHSPLDLEPNTFARFPIEIAAVVLLLSLGRGAVFRLVQIVVAVLLAVTLFLKLADLGVEKAFQRPFNPYLDFRLLADGWNVLSGAIGQFTAFAVVAGVLLAWLAIALVFFFFIGSIGRLDINARRGLVIFAIVLLIGGGSIAFLGARQNVDYHVEAGEVPFLINRITAIRTSITDMKAFEGELDRRRQALGSAPPQMQALAGKDVVLIFIESYGRSAVEDPRYAPTIDRRLASVDQELTQAGLFSASGWLKSPTVSGISWLAHSTLLSGLWIDNQARYDRLVSSDLPSLNRTFHSNGWRTVAVEPAITREWHEAGYFGYDAVYASHNLGYRGKPFNWVTMPDQFTLQSFENKERQPGHKPVMAEMALISSHAPWTPIPKLVDWDAIGDGTIFNEQATSGDSPEFVWADNNRIRAQYLASIDYTLQTLGSYMARYGRNTVFILLGDHQPAPVVTGDGASRDVPIHIVSSDPGVIKTLDQWGWHSGMQPGDKTAIYGMDQFREKLTASFSH